MDIAALIAVFLIGSTLMLLLFGYLTTRAVLPTASTFQIEGFLQQMTELLEMRQYQAVIEHCDARLQQEPHFAVAYWFRAQAYQAQGENELAIGDYTSALEHVDVNDRTTQAELLQARGLSWQASGDHQMAVRDFDDRLNIVPGDAAGRLARATSLYQVGDLNNALHDADVAIEIDSLDANAFDLRSRIKKDKGDHDGAAVDIRKALRLRGPE